MREKDIRTDFLDDEDRIPQNEYNGVIAALDELDTNEKNHYLRLPPSREIAKRAREHNEHARVARNRYAIAQERARAKYGHEPTTAEVMSELIDMHRAMRGKDPLEVPPPQLEGTALWLHNFMQNGRSQSDIGNHTGRGEIVDSRRDLSSKNTVAEEKQDDLFEQEHWEHGD